VAVLLPQLGRLFDAGEYGAAFGVTALIPVAGTVIWLMLSRGERTMLV
jgi:hypothetical protein